MMDATPIVERLRAADSRASMRATATSTSRRASPTRSRSRPSTAARPTRSSASSTHLLREPRAPLRREAEPDAARPRRGAPHLPRRARLPGADPRRRPSRRTRDGTRPWTSSAGSGDTREPLGLGFGVKFSNTLIVENHRDFFPKAREADVPLRAAAPRAGHGARAAASARRSARALPHLVLCGHRPAELRRPVVARPRARHGLHRPPPSPAATGACAITSRTSASADRCGARDSRSSRSSGKAKRRGALARSTAGRGPMLACLHRARGEGGSAVPRPARRLRPLGATRRASEHAALPGQDPRRPALRRGGQQQASHQGGHQALALRLPHLRQVHPRLPQRRQLRLHLAADRDPGRQAPPRAARTASTRERGRRRSASRRSTRSPPSPTSATSAATATSSAPRTAAPTSSSRASSAATRLARLTTHDGFHLERQRTRGRRARPLRGAVYRPEIDGGAPALRARASTCTSRRAIPRRPRGAGQTRRRRSTSPTSASWTGCAAACSTRAA